MLKMAKHTYDMNILRSHFKILKYFWPFFNIMHERVTGKLKIVVNENKLAFSTSSHL